MSSVFTIASVLEVGLVVAAAVIFVAMIVTAVAVIVWFVGGVFSVTQQEPAPHH